MDIQYLLDLSIIQLDNFINLIPINLPTFQPIAFVCGSTMNSGIQSTILFIMDISVSFSKTGLNIKGVDRNWVVCVR